MTQDQSTPANAQGASEALGRFGWHPDPAIDFEIEVGDIEAELINIKGGFENGTPSLAEIRHRIATAMTFQVGAVETAVNAKHRLRELETEAFALAALSGAEAKVLVKPLEWSIAKALGRMTKLLAFDAFGNEFARLDINGQSDAEISAFKIEKDALYEQRILSALASPILHPAGAKVVAFDPRWQFDGPALVAARKIMELTSQGKYDDRQQAAIQCAIIDAMQEAFPPTSPVQQDSGWTVDRSTLAEAASDNSLSDGAVRSLCLLRDGEITDEVKAWAESALLPSPNKGGA